MGVSFESRMEPQEHPVLVFDGVCNMCNGFVSFVLAHERDEQLRFAASQTDGGAAIVDQHGVGHLVRDYVIFIERGETSSGMPAVRKALARLSTPWRLLRFLTYLPRPVDDWAYRLIAHSRYRVFGQRSECMVPSEEVRARFL